MSFELVVICRIPILVTVLSSTSILVVCSSRALIPKVKTCSLPADVSNRLSRSTTASSSSSSDGVPDNVQHVNWCFKNRQIKEAEIPCIRNFAYHVRHPVKLPLHPLYLQALSGTRLQHLLQQPKSRKY